MPGLVHPPYLGLYRDNGKENGNYYIITGYILGLYWSYSIYPWVSPQYRIKNIGSPNPHTLKVRTVYDFGNVTALGFLQQKHGRNEVLAFGVS